MLRLYILNLLVLSFNSVSFITYLSCIIYWKIQNTKIPIEKEVNLVPLFPLKAILSAYWFLTKLVYATPLKARYIITKELCIVNTNKLELISI